MTTDRHYLLFVHGVNTRDRKERPEYADYLFHLIESKVKANAPDIDLRKVAFYWGDVNQDDEDWMLENVKQSAMYPHCYMKHIRETQIQQFVGDAALYISRTCGAKVVSAIRQQAEKAFEDFDPTVNNCVHLITHSWGTVILLDVLFADRWDDQSAPGHEMVQEIRQILFGLSPSENEGLFIRSIHTMGSPIAMISLLEKVDPVSAMKAQAIIPLAKLPRSSRSSAARTPAAAGVSPAHPVPTAGKTHSITDHLQKLLDSLNAELKAPLPWHNYAHPGDLIAYPLSELLPKMLTTTDDRIRVTDYLVQDAGPRWLEEFDKLAILRAGDAHGSYWHSNMVSEEIARAVLASKV